MTPLFDVALAFFADDGWQVARAGDDTRLVTRFSGEHAEFECRAATEEEDRIFIFHVVAELHADKAALLELVTRVNFGLYLGNFELDVATDELRFKTSVDVTDDRLTPALVRNAVYAACLTMDRHWPALQQLAAGATVEHALATLDAT